MKSSGGGPEQVNRLARLDSPGKAHVLHPARPTTEDRASQWGEDRAHSPATRSVQALAGTGSVPWKSGESATVQMRFACLKPLRNTWYQFAWQRTRDEPWAEASEQRKRAEGKRHRMAVRALATVWMRVIFTLWTTREASQHATFEEAQRLYARRAA